LACGHSEPFVTVDQEISGPFAATLPLRLTYSLLSDYEPGISDDGTLLTYQFERGTSDHDRCIAILPANGGQRQAELCPWALDQAGRADGLANAALRADGMLAFTMHSGLVGNLTSNSAGLYLAPSDSLLGAVRVLKLLDRPSGAQSVWQDLIDPTWISPDELMLLAGERFLANATSACTAACGGWVPYDLDRTALRDTIILGNELARLRIGNGTATVTSTLRVPTSTAWSLDRSTGTAYVVSKYVSPFDDFVMESVADTVFAVDLSGAPLTPRYGTAPIKGDRFLEQIHGIASGEGRVFLSLSWRGTTLAGSLNILPGTVLHSEISELLPDGSLRPVAPAVSWRWGKLRLSHDGRYLYAEAHERTSADIYRIELAS
jgi:hypothetical protein